MNWLKIIIASIFEVAWVVGLNHATTSLEWILTIIAIFMSFYLLIKASKILPVGTAYAIFVGLGTTGVTVLDFVVFGKAVNYGQIILILTLLGGVICLKLVTSKEGGEA
ncbi:DMT family transporter [Staphylococcus succinus]|jgi:paired small multidrug resistance pump|uniref:QacE family quaternary ammonium compound efflux SMR transporter n=1 Tax=Staphylococcus succinus TaxID=61015 RepID=A0A9Q6HPS4_9STAP|nr:SMR family transporter [Staphylococcus succinus]MEB8127855.1 SMR family transporter [Staphylococcus succinus]PTI41769.1 QacE family quaternary ammonium compound efflux SMR transporter [Staphylococcus succinus]PTI76367.1 QacE family quaternary ammonium compound efflux SMR transporter [Staphylococcus succinus]PTJ19413.1 QacE family quaternary ammonium compound efflux SMR transporter [Staphylococcus succinus]RIN28721.1 QacE family quaternary ammonium compound efflux SMR transporter [Staphyloco